MDQEDGYDSLINEVCTTAMEEYWIEYQKIEYQLGRTGNDLSHDLERIINKTIEKMLSEKIDELITKIAEENIKDLITQARKEFETISKVKSIEIEYKPIKEVA